MKTDDYGNWAELIQKHLDAGDIIVYQKTLRVLWLDQGGRGLCLTDFWDQVKYAHIFLPFAKLEVEGLALVPPNPTPIKE